MTFDLAASKKQKNLNITEKLHVILYKIKIRRNRGTTQQELEAEKKTEEHFFGDVDWAM